MLLALFIAIDISPVCTEIEVGIQVNSGLAPNAVVVGIQLMARVVLIDRQTIGFDIVVKLTVGSYLTIEKIF
ncbi:Uncharacterised protein [Segatella copri]|nr:Uncharacterised protein [Segatella copri]